MAARVWRASSPREAAIHARNVLRTLVDFADEPTKNQPEADFLLVPGRGFEPRYPPPEGGVLPLDDPGRIINNARKIPFQQTCVNFQHTSPHLPSSREKPTMR